MTKSLIERRQVEVVDEMHDTFALPSQKQFEYATTFLKTPPQAASLRSWGDFDADAPENKRAAYYGDF
jgi:hypothetical protein